MNPFRVGKKSGKKSKRVDLVDLQGKSGAPVVVILPYGMFANASDNSAVGVLADQCNEASLYGIPFTVNMDQLETLEPGDVAFGIPKEKSRVLFKSGNKIIFRDSNNEGGDYMVRFNELKIAFDQLKTEFNSLVAIFNTHIHLDPSNVSPFTGTTPTPGAPSTALIDGAKIDDIEVPSK